MGYIITDPVGLIIAVLNVTTIALLIYVLLQAVADRRSKLLRVLDRLFSPVSSLLRRVLPESRIDLAPVVAAILLQMIAFFIKRRY